ncbi:hypothetical protein [Formosa sp. Hel1_31_208]|uniref:hypothetical protein n=1 Tax=Formosa sp. Hel1_31_208 TaxID=1798225 RepID=UPI001E496369|nr:hypothetical protein [Formosa sp. Hel1_31_208]
MLFPITLESKDWNKRKRSNADKRKFSTLFKVKFYKNDNGIPGDVMTYSNIVFRVTEKNGDAFKLDISEHNLFIPKGGFFVSLQVLGYTDPNGKLLPNKKYKEIKSKNGIVKIQLILDPYPLQMKLINTTPILNVCLLVEMGTVQTRQWY